MALIPPDFFNCVVALGVRQSSSSVKWTGTGTLIGRFFRKFTETENQYHIFIATNRHVLESQEAVVVRFNPMGSQPAKDYDIPLHDKTGKPLWKMHKTVDAAVIGLNADALAEENVHYSYFQSDNHAMPLAEMRDAGVSEGDSVFILGFPMGIVEPARQYVISRSGIIARVRDTFEKQNPDFLIDAAIFPGNSGGPVIYKPEIISIAGTKSVLKPGLIGIVSSYLVYKDVAVSQQTGKPRIMFEENSGLAVVIPIDYVLETIDLAFSVSNIKESPVIPAALLN